MENLKFAQHAIKKFGELLNIRKIVKRADSIAILLVQQYLIIIYVARHCPRTFVKILVVISKFQEINFIAREFVELSQEKELPKVLKKKFL